MQCIDTSNQIEDIKRDYSDEFIRIKLLKGYMIVYALNGKVFSTKCEEVDLVEIPDMEDVCTRDVPIFYMKRNNKAKKGEFFAFLSHIRWGCAIASYRLHFL
jgi:hypothetical protein